MKAQKQEEWTIVARQTSGNARVECRTSNGMFSYRLVAGELTWPLDDTEGYYWETTVSRVGQEMVDYHLGNLALAHSMCLDSGSTFAQQAEER